MSEINAREVTIPANFSPQEVQIFESFEAAAQAGYQAKKNFYSPIGVSADEANTSQGAMDEAYTKLRNQSARQAFQAVIVERGDLVPYQVKVNYSGGMEPDHFESRYAYHIAATPAEQIDLSAKLDPASLRAEAGILSR